jgi:SAM-dependent methyltransferase
MTLQRGWGEWTPLASELPTLPVIWHHYCPEQQHRERPPDYLPELDLVLGCAAGTGGPILDLACGTGRVSHVLARHGFPTVGLDLNPQFIRKAQELTPSPVADGVSSLRFEVGDARAFSLPERFALVVMLDQSFKYLLTHDDQLACLSQVRRHLLPHGRFLVEHRCMLKLPDAGPGTPYAYSWNDEEWAAIDIYDAIAQVGVSHSQPLDQPDREPLLDPCRDFTYQELVLLHRVSGFELEAVWSDLGERSPDTTHFDAFLLLKPVAPWQPAPPAGGAPRRRPRWKSGAGLPSRSRKLRRECSRNSRTSV